MIKKGLENQRKNLQQLELKNEKTLRISKNKILERAKGITLIALIITIIILIILAGITIVALSGENGILRQAVKAKDKTEIAEIIDKAQVDVLGVQSENGGKISKEQLKTILEQYFKNVPNDYTIDTVLTAKDEYGKHEIQVSDIYKGSFSGESGSAISIPEGLEIGTTVNYNPTGTYNWQAKYYSSDESDSNVTLDSSKSEYNINTWKVFDINEETGEITLVPATATTGIVKLQGAQGYNNGVYLLNEACSYLYGNEEKGIKARSINIEDIEGKMTDEALEEAHSFSIDEIKYKNQVPSEYEQSSSYYPSIYAKEILSVIDGNKNSSGLGMSEQISLIEPTDGGAINGYMRATGIQPYLTMWMKDMQTAFKTVENNINYYNLICPEGTEQTYYVASRSLIASDEVSIFVMSIIDRGVMNGARMLDSDCTTDGYAFALFPIVSLNATIIRGNATDGFTVE